MTGATHVVLALGTLGVQSYFTGYNLTPLGMVMILFGALAPDIDGGGLVARPGKLFRPWVGRKGAAAINAPGLFISDVARDVFGHRGFLHTPFFAACMALVGIMFGLEWLIFFTWGYVTHIFGDFCTVAGIPVFGPFSWERYRLMSVRNGTLGETAVAILLIVASIIWSWIP